MLEKCDGAEVSKTFKQEAMGKNSKNATTRPY